MRWILWLTAFAALVVASLAYLSWYFRWEARQTAGVAYLGRTLAGRRALKRRIRLLSLPALPIAWMLSLLARRQSELPSFVFEGVHGPARVSSPDVFARARAYQPQSNDVFVATQMRCGTTWMQQLVYQIVTRGQGDFTDAGLRHLNVASPWIDSVNTISMEHAPLVGMPPVRIVKTHLPAELCPYSPTAKYIYVTRHPVSCFASIVDFTRSMVGPFLPSVDALAGWYCSDRMYWLPWPKHVEGWWRWSNEKPNVLFVHFEEMTREFSSVRDRVAAFLGHALTPDEQLRVSERCTFAYMKDHEDLFEMAPPTMYSAAGGAFLASGKERRDEDVTPEVRARILKYCRDALVGASYPATRIYKDLA